MNNYRVAEQCIGVGKIIYKVYCLINPELGDQIGNRDFVGTFDDEDVAQEFADELNRRHDG